MQTGKILASVVAGTVGMAVTTGAVAAESQQSLDDRFYIAPMISYGFFGSDTIQGPSHQVEFERDDAVGGTLAFGKPINKWLNLELYGFYFNPDQKIDVDNGPNYSPGNGEIWGVGIDAMLFPARNALPVYGLLGASFGQNGINMPTGMSSGTTSSENAFARYYDVGVGYAYPITDYGIKVRAEYRFRYSQVDVPAKDAGNAYFTDNIVSVGLQIPLGAPSQPKPVDTEPAPMPEPEPVDSDNDGVLDANDACPNTMAGAKVDANGCKIETQPEPIELQGVTFRFDKATLTDQAERRLQSVVSALHAAPKVEFRLDGYTDSIGSKAYNMRLSKRRVDSVKGYLLNHEISPMRITATEGHGEANPVATNSTEWGRAQNRRVEITVTEGPNQ